VKTYATPLLANAHLEDLAWLEGTWRGRINGDYVEEIWAMPTASAMMGMFRWAAAGKLRFYEFMVIAESGGSIVMKIKHFSPDLSGWEEKNESIEFFLSELHNRQAVFFQRSENKPLWLVYESLLESALKISFEPRENSPVVDKEFSMQKVL